MTATELKTRFLIGYEFIANNAAPGYTNSEISGFLNQAMDLLVDELFGANDIANIAELLTKKNPNLVAYSTTSGPEYYGESSVWCEQNSLSDLRWLTNAKVKVLRTEPFSVNNEWIECEQIPKHIAEKWVSTSINKPIIVYPKIVWHGETNGFVVIYDSYSTVSEFQVMYIRTPERINIDLYPSMENELNPRLHQKIADKAVQLAMKATDAKRAEGEIQLNKAI